MKEIRTFKHEVFGSLRAILTEDGEPLLMGSDVAKRLGYKNPQKALRDHVDEEDKTLNESFTVNGTHPILINESGLYALVLSSKLPTAKAFKRWVTAEVLPQIRKTGGYIPTHDADGRALTNEEVLALADQIVGRTLKLVNAPCIGCLTATEVARSWGMDAVERGIMALRYATLLLEMFQFEHKAWDEIIIERKGTNWWVHFAVKPSGNGRYLTVINKTR